MHKDAIGCIFMLLKSVLVLSGNEFKTTLDVLPVDTLQKNRAVQRRVTELEYTDHLRGAGLAVGSTSTVAFRYIIRRVDDNSIVQRNDDKPRPVRRSGCSVNVGESVLFRSS